MAEKDTSTLLIFYVQSAQCSHGPVVRSGTIFAEGSWGAGSNPGLATAIFFSSFIVFLPFGVLLFILTAGSVSFARFFAKTY